MIKPSSWHIGLLLFILLITAVYFPVFLHLDYMPFKMWDESILGVNALEMEHNHNPIVTYFYGYPDMYRCKPPLMLWVIILFTKVLGFSELSLRLPSALAAASLCIYLFFMLRKITGNYLFGFFAVCVLVTCQGYIGIHITRTGEYDSFWLLFSVVYSLSLFMAVETEDAKIRSKHLLIFFIFFTLALLTKGIGCMLYLLPGFMIYALMRRKSSLLLKDKAFYIGLAAFIIFGLGYYFLREWMTPGYLQVVLAQEIRPRLTGVEFEFEGPFVRHHPALYFIKRIITSQFTAYMFMFPVALLVGTRFAEPELKKLLRFALLIGITYFVVISLGGKKVPHYDAYCFIYMSFIMASFLYVLYLAISKQLASKNAGNGLSQVLAFVCILSLLGGPYYNIIKTVYFPKDEWEGSFSESCTLFQQAVRGRADINGYKLIFDALQGYGQATVLTCYKEELTEHGISIKFAGPGELNTGDKAVVFDSINKQLIERNYNIETLNHLDYCNADVIQVKGECH